ncbi:uncharacterized protein LOC125209154 [Salvia hispanica]|uniref:uncharacterized protein LOC125209154 n=1 Tax=Salvia hispanica TaxID=49212 RepID=UPI0020096B08|nr:uncharacterized protein LOC125209154 [Salvia hispanica]
MARPSPNSMHHQFTSFIPFGFFIALAAIFSVFSAVIFMCGAHHGMIASVMGREKTKTKTKTVRLGGENKKKGMEKVKSSLSSKALLMSKMVSWRKVDDCAADDEEEEDDVVWKKTIIKGDKCRPIDFSGKILYDSDGNLLPD